MDQEMKAYLDEQFGRIYERFERMEERSDRTDERLERMDERLERVETEVRHTHVSVEAVRSDVRLVAEGVVGLTERMEKFQAETTLGFENVKASIAPYYQNLNTRMKVLEDWSDRQTEDVLDTIRKKYGRQSQ